MRRKCAICGIELEENIAVCPKCSTRNYEEVPAHQPVPAAPLVADFPEVSAMPTMPEKKKQKILPFILGGAAVVIVVVVILLCSLLGNTPEPTPEPTPTTSSIVPTSILYKYLALMNGDVDQLESIAPEQFWQHHAQSENKTVEESLTQNKNILASVLKRKRQEYGNYQATGEMLSESPLNEQTMAKIIQALSRYGIAERSITAGRSLRIKVSLVTQNNTAVGFDNHHLNAIQIDGVWYLVTCMQDENDFIVSFFSW